MQRRKGEATAPQGERGAKGEIGAERIVSGDPGATLDAIVEGDPLHLRQRADLRLRESALVLDNDRLYHCAVARVAMATSRDGTASKSLLDDCIDEAIDDLLRRDAVRLAAGEIELEDGDSCREFLVSLLGIEPGSTLAARVAFNGLAPHVRRAFRALVIDCRRPEDCARELGCTTDDLRSRVLLALERIFDAVDPKNSATRRPRP